MAAGEFTAWGLRRAGLRRCGWHKEVAADDDNLESPTYATPDVEQSC